MFDSIKKYFLDIEKIEIYKNQEYMRGVNTASSQFINEQREMMNKITELSSQNLSMEKRVRESSDARIKQLEDIHSIKCSACRNNLENERKRLIHKQALLADRMDKVYGIYKKLAAHSELLVEEHMQIMQSSAKVASSRDFLVTFRRDMDEILSSAEPLLSVELVDSQIVADHKMNQIREEAEHQKEVDSMGEQPPEIVIQEEVK